MRTGLGNCKDTGYQAKPVANSVIEVADRGRGHRACGRRRASRVTRI